MDNATPIDVQPTWDYWATVEATDLTQIAGEQSADETEIALPPLDPNATFAAAGLATPTTASTAIAAQLPNTGSGSMDGGAVGFALLLAVLLILAMIPVVRRFLA